MWLNFFFYQPKYFECGFEIMIWLLGAHSTSRPRRALIDIKKNSTKLSTNIKINVSYVMILCAWLVIIDVKKNKSIVNSRSKFWWTLLTTECFHFFNSFISWVLECFIFASHLCVRSAMIRIIIFPLPLLLPFPLFPFLYSCSFPLSSPSVLFYFVNNLIQTYVE